MQISFEVGVANKGWYVCPATNWLAYGSQKTLNGCGVVEAFGAAETSARATLVVLKKTNAPKKPKAIFLIYGNLTTAKGL